MQLSPEERETIISFDETTADAVVWTYNKSWQKQIEIKLGIKPTLVNHLGGKEYQVPKKRIRMPLAPRKLSSEQRQKMGERLRETRHQKSPVVSRNNVITMKLKGEKSGEGNQSRKKRQPKVARVSYIKGG